MFAPLNRALHDPDALRLLLYNLGWEAEIEAALLEEEPYASLAAEVADLIDQGTLLVRDLTDSDGDNDAAFEALLDVIATLRAFVADLSQVDGLPPGITDPDFWAAARARPPRVPGRALPRAPPARAVRAAAARRRDRGRRPGARGLGRPSAYVRRRDRLGPPGRASSATRPGSCSRSTTGTTAGRSTTRACSTSWRASPGHRRRPLRAAAAAPADRRFDFYGGEPAARRRARGGAAGPPRARSTARSPSRAC